MIEALHVAGRISALIRACVTASRIGPSAPTRCHSESHHFDLRTDPDLAARELSAFDPRRYGCHSTSTPFVRLNVCGVQNDAALRYQP
jgi:hypothetical protein